MKGKILVRRMLRSPQFMIGFFIVFGIVIVSVFARQLAPMDENMNHIVARFTPPQGIDAYKTSKLEKAILAMAVKEGEAIDKLARLYL